MGVSHIIKVFANIIASDGIVSSAGSFSALGWVLSGPTDFNSFKLMESVLVHSLPCSTSPIPYRALHPSAFFVYAHFASHLLAVYFLL